MSNGNSRVVVIEEEHSAHESASLLEHDQLFQEPSFDQPTNGISTSAQRNKSTENVNNCNILIL